jgi:hypothetical protein
MRLEWGVAGPRAVRVTLEVGGIGSVALQEPVTLARMVHAPGQPIQWQNIPSVATTPPDPSTRSFDVPVGGQPETDLMLSWWAIDPMHEHLPYTATVTVSGAGGNVAAKLGWTNPFPRPCEIGPTPPYIDQRVEPISIA